MLALEVFMNELRKYISNNRDYTHFGCKLMMTIDSIDYICNGEATRSPSSDEDNSPSEWNKCKRLVDKPPLVKRLTMGFLKTHEECKPLMNVDATSLDVQKSNLVRPLYRKSHLHSNGYVNEISSEPDEQIANKFGDSCRQSWTTIPCTDLLNITTNNRNDISLKKKYIRETSSANSSPKIFANRLHTNHQTNQLHLIQSSIGSVKEDADDVHAEDIELRKAPWFQAGLSRDIAEEILSSKVPGAFFVRRSTSRPGCYALTVRIPSPPGPKTANYIILQTIQGYKIKGFHKEFKTMKALITHHSVMPESLPVPLAMPRPSNVYTPRRLDDFDTYDSLKSIFTYLRSSNLEGD